MPIYEAYCSKCHEVAEYVSTVANCRITPTCCGESMQKVILSAPSAIVDIPAYVSPVSGKLINSRTQRNEDLKRTGSRPWEGLEQEKKEAARQKAYQEQKEDAKLEKAISETYYAMPPEKRRVLETSL